MLGDSVRRRQAGRKSHAGERQPARRERSGGALRTLGWLLAALIVPFGIGYAISAFLLFPPTEATPTGGVAVPRLIGMNVGEAERELAAMGLGRVEARELPHPSVPAGAIIAQDPLAGQRLQPGAGLRVGVSAGPARMRVPDVTGFAEERARGLLHRLGFSTRSQEREADAPRGRVLAIEPAPGADLTLPASLTLIVSSGPPAVADDSSVIVPDEIIPPPPPGR